MNTTKALMLLKENGYKHTKQREKLIDIFQSNSHYVPVSSIWKEFEKDFPGASYDTVYRNLYTMAQIGVLEKTNLDGEKYFRLHCDVEGHHHHFICLDCGKTSPIDVCPMEEIEGRLPNYQIENHKFEVYGKCPACQ